MESPSPDADSTGRIRRPPVSGMSFNFLGGAMAQLQLRRTVLVLASVLCIGCEDDGEPAASATAPSVEDSANDQGSPDVGMVVFQSQATNLVNGDTNDRDDIFVRDLQIGATTRVSVGGAGSQGDSHSGTWRL